MWRINQKPSAFESPARFARGELGTSALGRGDTPSSYTNLPDPGGGWADSGVVLQVLPLAVTTGRGRGPIPSRGRKLRSCPHEGRPVEQIPCGRWRGSPGVQGLGRGDGDLWNLTPSPLAEETSQAGELGKPGCYCWNAFPPTPGVLRGWPARRKWDVDGERQAGRGASRAERVPCASRCGARARGSAAIPGPREAAPGVPGNPSRLSLFGYFRSKQLVRIKQTHTTPPPPKKTHHSNANFLPSVSPNSQTH